MRFAHFKFVHCVLIGFGCLLSGCSDSAQRAAATGSNSGAEAEGPEVADPNATPAVVDPGDGSPSSGAGMGELGAGDIGLVPPDPGPGTEDPMSGEEMPPVAPPEPTELVWPNEESHTNSDPWLPENHDLITRLEPRVLLINFDESETIEVARAFAQTVAGAFAEGSRYQGYKNAEAPVFLDYQIAHVVDLPNDKTRTGNRFGYAEFMHDRTFAEKVGFKHPESGATLTVCEMFEQGFINEAWVAEPPDDSAKLYEFLSRAQEYDASFAKLPGSFDPCAGNGCIPANEITCGVTVRLGELNLSRGPGCATHAHGHGLERQIQQGIIPYLSANARRFFNFGLDERHDTPFPDFYRCPSGTTPCIEYVTPSHLVNGPGLPAFEIDNFGDGCGNVHFAPHSRFHYDYERQSAGVNASASCEHYGLADGEGGADQTTTISYDTYRAYNEDPAYRDCGGGWSIYMRQSFPGFQNPATGVDGEPMKNWWPFLYY